MPMKVLEATLATFDGVFQQFTNEAANNKANFILFYADKEPSTNLSWCPGKLWDHLQLLVVGSYVVRRIILYCIFRDNTSLIIYGQEFHQKTYAAEDLKESYIPVFWQ
ncbi:uncharacterized protein LOC121754115 isoform X1 [Salvia splendens]|uniref:uncharacterized protein LOC121754115 isoform X1 n=1 Tax=Salvia splendens TaxID=180675 RepID=UPI001C27D4C1|nr:uncharacterized protein LOC121754115 isoform X1 [Salvia splendens]